MCEFSFGKLHMQKSICDQVFISFMQSINKAQKANTTFSALGLTFNHDDGSPVEAALF